MRDVEKQRGHVRGRLIPVQDHNAKLVSDQGPERPCRGEHRCQSGMGFNLICFRTEHYTITYDEQNLGPGARGVPC